MEFRTPIRGLPEGKTLDDCRKLAIVRGQLQLYHTSWSPASDAVSEGSRIFGRWSLAGGNGSLSVGLADHIDCPIQALGLCFLTAEVI